MSDVSNRNGNGCLEKIFFHWSQKAENKYIFEEILKNKTKFNMNEFFHTTSEEYPLELEMHFFVQRFLQNCPDFLRHLKDGTCTSEQQLESALFP